MGVFFKMFVGKGVAEMMAVTEVPTPTLAKATILVQTQDLTQ
jgi:hypothetical protein